MNLKPKKKMKKTDYIYHVYSGLDAFEFTANDGKKIYLPYVAVIAENELEAREKTAWLFGQTLENQTSAVNYVSNHVIKQVEF